MARFGMVIDLGKCTGCRACVQACKIENNTPKANLWMDVFRFEEGEYPDTHVWFMPRPCQHCDNAPCVKVCPVGARYKRLDGLVSTDWGRCIGCRYCEVACPYGVNFFNWKEPVDNQYLDWEDEDLNGTTNGVVPPYSNPDLEGEYGDEGRHVAGGGRMEGVMEKCTFCVQRTEKGLSPACMDVCPTFAIKFGDLDDPESEVSRLLRDNQAFRLLEEEGTEPRVYYIGGHPPASDIRQIEELKARV